MAGFSIDIDADAFLRDLKAYPVKTERALRGALFQEAEELITAAKRLTPVDEGVLRASGHVLKPTWQATTITVKFGFGGPAGAGNVGGSNPEKVGYAVYVHEDLTARHTVGQAKYLEVPMNQRKASMSARISRRLKRRLSVV